MNHSANIISFNRKEHDRLADAYDSSHSEIYNPFEQRRIAQALKETVSQIRTNSDNPLVLDFGSGTGNLTSHLLNLNVNVLAADVSEKSLEHLKEKVNFGNQLQTTILNGVDLSQFPDNSFDMIATYSVLHHVPDYLQIIKEFLRVVKPGGIIYIDHEVCLSYWCKDKNYQRYLDELGEDFSENHLVELEVSWHFKLLRKSFDNLFSKVTSRKSWKNLLKKLTGVKNVPVQISDIHVFKHDHIEWDDIKKILLPQCKIIKDSEYLVCRERSAQAPVWHRWNSKCADMRMLIVRKI
ncbi:MAG: methyltransferase domain-containing protein [Desulfurivibrionaceae bacterium]